MAIFHLSTVPMSRADGRSAVAAAAYRSGSEMVDDRRQHERIVALRSAGKSIAETARLAECSASQVKRIWAETKHGNASASMSS